jgi:hypothetical protein
VIVPLGEKSLAFFRAERAANAVGESGGVLEIVDVAVGGSGAGGDGGCAGAAASGGDSADLIAKAGGPARDEARSGSTGSETGRGRGISVGVVGSGVSARARRGSTGGIGMRP